MTNIHGKLHQSVRSVVDSIKDDTTRSIVAAFSSGNLKIDRAQLAEVLQIIGASIDNAYNKSSREVDRAIDDILELRNV